MVTQTTTTEQHLYAQEMLAIRQALAYGLVAQHYRGTLAGEEAAALAEQCRQRIAELNARREGR